MDFFCSIVLCICRWVFAICQLVFVYTYGICCICPSYFLWFVYWFYFSPKNILCKGGFFLFANGSAGILFPILRALVKSVENWSVQPSGSERHSLGFDSKMITMMIWIMMIMMVNMKLIRVTKTRCQIWGTIELHRD